MLEKEELHHLMSFVGKGKRSGEAHPLPDDNDTVDGLLSLLSLPELREENNPDFPFEVVAQYRGNACGDALQTVGMKNLHYDPEFQFLADWTERLTGRPGLHCFDRQLKMDFEPADGVLFQIRMDRIDAKNTLYLASAGTRKKVGPIEIWEKGNLIRRTEGCGPGSEIPVSVQDGTAVVVRYGSIDSGVEILIAEGEFGPDEWKALLGCLCLQGRFGKALDLFNNQITEDSTKTPWLPRFRSFLSGVAAVTKTDGYVLRPLPVMRSQNTSAEVAPVWEGEGPKECQDAWETGWNLLAQREFGHASKSFAFLQDVDSRTGRHPLEERLIRHLESLSSVNIPLKEEIELTARFWEGVFQDLFSMASH